MISRHEIHYLIAYALALVLSGCSTYRGLVGFEATNLSHIKPGISREKVEQTIGKPTCESRTSDVVKAHYVVDLGYIPPAEENDSLKWLTPVILFGDLITAGTYGLLTEHDEGDCQLGKVVIIYDPHGNVLGAKVFSSGADSDAYKSHKRRGHCSYVMHHPRPATLDPSLELRFDEFDINLYNEAETDEPTPLEESP